MDPSICFLTPADKEDNRGLMERRLEARQRKEEGHCHLFEKILSYRHGVGGSGTRVSP